MYENYQLTRKQKIQVCVVTGVVVAGYVWHRRKLDEIITLSREAVQETMWDSFDSGVKYGLQLVRDAAVGDVFAKIDVDDAVKGAEYAFKAFDKVS